MSEERVFFLMPSENEISYKVKNRIHEATIS